MKNLILTSTLLFIITYSHAAVITVVTNNGDWQTTTTWDLNRLPANGDVVNIPAGKTVKIGANVNLAPSNITINNYGTINFTGSHRILLGATSVVYVYSGGVISNIGGVNDFLQIGASTVWDQTTGNINGAKYATATTSPGFVPFTPMPVIFVSFSVTARANNILIQWATAQELNASYFDIEKSEDGAKWVSIAQVSAKGFSSSLTSYSFEDKNMNSDKIYYRIKQVDIDGKFTYTTVKYLTFTSITKSGIQILNNNHSVIINFPEQLNTSVIIRLVSFSGQVIDQQTLNAPSGQILFAQNNSLHGNFIVSISNVKQLMTAKKVQL